MPPRAGPILIVERRMTLCVRGVAASATVRSQAFAASMLSRQVPGQMKSDCFQLAAL
jgi:hypothetical protein